MDPSQGNQGLPGLSTRVDQTSRKFLTDNNHKSERGMSLPSSVQDVGNTPVTKLRAGLVLVRVEAAGANLGKYVHVTHADAPAAVDIKSALLLMQDINMLGHDGAVEAKVASGLIHGFVDDTKLTYGTTDDQIKDSVRGALPLVMFENVA